MSGEHLRDVFPHKRPEWPSGPVIPPKIRSLARTAGEFVTALALAHQGGSVMRAPDLTSFHPDNVGVAFHDPGLGNEGVGRKAPRAERTITRGRFALPQRSEGKGGRRTTIQGEYSAVGISLRGRVFPAESSGEVSSDTVFEEDELFVSQPAVTEGSPTANALRRAEGRAQAEAFQSTLEKQGMVLDAFSSWSAMLAGGDGDGHRKAQEGNGELSGSLVDLWQMGVSPEDMQLVVRGQFEAVADQLHFKLGERVGKLNPQDLKNLAKLDKTALQDVGLGAFSGELSENQLKRTRNAVRRLASLVQNGDSSKQLLPATLVDELPKDADGYVLAGAAALALAGAYAVSRKNLRLLPKALTLSLLAASCAVAPTEVPTPAVTQPVAAEHVPTAEAASERLTGTLTGVEEARGVEIIRGFREDVRNALTPDRLITPFEVRFSDRTVFVISLPAVRDVEGGLLAEQRMFIRKEEWLELRRSKTEIDEEQYVAWNLPTDWEEAATQPIFRYPARSALAIPGTVSALEVTFFPPLESVEGIEGYDAATGIKIADTAGVSASFFEPPALSISQLFPEEVAEKVSEVAVTDSGRWVGLDEKGLPIAEFDPVSSITSAVSEVMVRDGSVLAWDRDERTWNIPSLSLVGETKPASAITLDNGSWLVVDEQGMPIAQYDPAGGEWGAVESFSAGDQPRAWNTETLAFENLTILSGSDELLASRGWGNVTRDLDGSVTIEGSYFGGGSVSNYNSRVELADIKEDFFVLAQFHWSSGNEKAGITFINEANVGRNALNSLEFSFTDGGRKLSIGPFRDSPSSFKWRSIPLGEMGVAAGSEDTAELVVKLQPETGTAQVFINGRLLTMVDLGEFWTADARLRLGYNMSQGESMTFQQLEILVPVAGEENLRVSGLDQPVIAMQPTPGGGTVVQPTPMPVEPTPEPPPPVYPLQYGQIPERAEQLRGCISFIDWWDVAVHNMLLGDSWRVVQSVDPAVNQITFSGEQEPQTVNEGGIRRMRMLGSLERLQAGLLDAKMFVDLSKFSVSDLLAVLQPGNVVRLQGLPAGQLFEFVCYAPEGYSP